MKIPTIPADKAQHYFWGSIAGGAGALLAVALHLPAQMAPVFALAAALVAGVWKEWSDDEANRAAEAAGEPLPHEVSGADVAWTVAGAASASIAAAAVAFSRG